MDALSIRLARPGDGAALAEIYRPYVLDTAITFEYEAPDGEEMARRVARTLERYPWLVAELDGLPVGYTYASAFKGRAAYDWAVETSIYLARGLQGRGIGRALHDALEKALAKQNVLNLNACIAYTEQETARLTKASVRFHEKLGYRLVGRFHQCGYKFGTWYDIVWMEKMLGPHGAAPAPFLPLQGGKELAGWKF